MEILVLISLIIAVGGIVAEISINNVPTSISSMVYSLKTESLCIWSIWLGIIILLIMPNLLIATEYIGWLTSVSLLGAAVTPIINKDTHTLHNVLGILGGILSQVCVFTISPWWLLVWIIFLLLLINCIINSNYTIIKDYGVFIIEILCAMSLYGALLKFL